MTSSLKWWLVGGLVAAFVLIGLAAMAAKPIDTNAGTGSGSGDGSTTGAPDTDAKAVPERCKLLADGSTLSIGQMLYSAGYTPLVATPDQKAPILASRFTGEPVGTPTGRTYLDTRYFSDGACFIEIMPHGGNGIVSDLPARVWVHPKHVTPKTTTT